QIAHIHPLIIGEKGEKGRESSNHRSRIGLARIDYSNQSFRRIASQVAECLRVYSTVGACPPSAARTISQRCVHIAFRTAVSGHAPIVIRHSIIIRIGAASALVHGSRRRRDCWSRRSGRRSCGECGRRGRRGHTQRCCRQQCRSCR
ncbi:hypothetical protein PMAYCL1PPCAC_05108, partial [Pristionchus mayeri]